MKDSGNVPNEGRNELIYLVGMTKVAGLPQQKENRSLEPADAVPFDGRELMHSLSL